MILMSEKWILIMTDLELMLHQLMERRRRIKELRQALIVYWAGCALLAVIEAVALWRVW